MLNKKNDIIISKDQLVAWFEQGCKPKKKWRIGTEHEKFIFTLKDNKRLSYHGECSISALLKGLYDEDGWEPVFENDLIIALKGQNGDSITLEPGGQFELSGAPLETIHQTCNEIHTHLDKVKKVCSQIGATAIGLGFDPLSRREDVSWMPKARYQIMRNYMPKRGSMGIDMMLRSCTVQVNLDYADESDMRNKMQISTALQPLAVALFANSPFIEGGLSNDLSRRAKCWQNTDQDRCGVPDIVFNPSFGFEHWVDFVLQVPMYFVKRSDVYHDVSGCSFIDFMQGKLSGFEGELPVMSDWIDHLTTVFTEVRLKQFIEMRGADGGAWGNLCALPAFWVGLLYDSIAIDEARQLIKGWQIEQIRALNIEAARIALKAEINGQSLQKIACEAIDIVKRGLKRRAKLNQHGNDESDFIDLLEEIAFTGQTLAERLLDYYHNRWYGDVTHIMSQSAY
ncbi:MAG: glutamate--cysteine ligase [Pseudomonadota bacterium]